MPSSPVTDKAALQEHASLPEFLEYVWFDNDMKVMAILRGAYRRDQFLNQIDPRTGMNALHIAVGRNNLPMTQMLVEAGINFIPDNEGRMPSLIAALCEVSDELADYIAEAEEKALSEQDPAV